MEENVTLEAPIQTPIQIQIEDEWDNHIGDSICF